MARIHLINAYISGLNLTSVSVVGAGCSARIITGEPAPGEIVQHQFFFRPSHAEMVLSRIGELSGQPAAELAGSIKQAAATLGAKVQTLDELRGLAARQVDEITERIRASGQHGKLKVWNARYKSYRLEQKANGGKAIGYWQYLEQAVTLPMVRSIAAGAG